MYIYSYIKHKLKIIISIKTKDPPQGLHIDGHNHEGPHLTLESLKNMRERSSYCHKPMAQGELLPLHHGGDGDVVGEVGEVSRWCSSSVSYCNLRW
jgi:hypothetical protein